MNTNELARVRRIGDVFHANQGSRSLLRTNIIRPARTSATKRLRHHPISMSKLVSPSSSDKHFFFAKYGLGERDLEKYLGAALSAGGDYADLYFEYLTSTALSVDESMIKSASQGISVGCGVRVVAGERTGYAYTDDLAPERILHAARTAALIASGPAKTPVVSLEDVRLKDKARPSLYPIADAASDAELAQKIDLVFRADKAARAYDPRIKEVRAGYADEVRRILVIGSDGTFAEDVQPLSR